MIPHTDRDNSDCPGLRLVHRGIEAAAAWKDTQLGATAPDVTVQTVPGQRR